MDPNELMMICKRFARASRNASEQEAHDFASWYVENYPAGNKQMSVMYDRALWRS